MNRDELVGALSQPYSTERGFGTKKIGRTGYENIWFVVPPKPPHTVTEKMSNESLLQLGDAGMGMVLPIRMAIGHTHFEAVHPFSDGNGRVGRMLWAFQMAAADRLPLYLSGYVEAQKSEYGAALQDAQKQLSYRRMIDFVCRAIIACTEEETVTQQVLEHWPGFTTT